MPHDTPPGGGNDEKPRVQEADAGHDGRPNHEGTAETGTAVTNRAPPHSPEAPVDSHVSRADPENTAE